MTKVIWVVKVTKVTSVTRATRVAKDLWVSLYAFVALETHVTLALLVVVQFQDGHECGLRDFHIADHLHAFLALFLLFEQFLLT